MAIDLVTKFLTYVDEMFSTESKKSLVTNNDFEWTGAKSVKVYRITTADMNDYDREGTDTANWSRYGAVQGLDAVTDEYTLTKDRSFTFAIDHLDADETQQALQGGTALARQQREVVIPEIDAYVFGVMCDEAGHKPTEVELTASNIYDEIIKATKALDDAEVPDTNRFLIVTTDIMILLKKCPDVVLNGDIGADLRLRGVVGILDGLTVVKVPSNRLPADFGFMVAHPCATVAPVKLETYTIHNNPPGINGDLVEGRIVYDAMVMTNKTKAIYYQAIE